MSNITATIPWRFPTLLRQMRGTLLLIAALLMLPLCVSADSGTSDAPPEPTIASVTVTPVVRADLIGRVSVSGTLVPREEVLIYPQVSGSTIETLEVDLGDSVRAGDILARLNADTLSAELAQAQAELARAEASVNQAQSQITSATASANQAISVRDRARRLKDAGTTTQTALDQAEADAQTADAALASSVDGLAVARAQLQQAKARLEIAQLNLDRATIRAPVDGLISERNGQVGAIATSTGAPVFRMIKGGAIEIEAEVIETALGQIEVGDRVDISIAGVGDMAGSVRRISPTVDPVNRLGTIRIAPEDQAGLRTGVFASGWVVTEARTSPAVPTTAVLTDTEGTFVLVERDGVLEKRAVTAGLIWNDLREIVSGVEPGEIVVAKAGSFFGDGDRITPILSEADGNQGASE